MLDALSEDVDDAVVRYLPLETVEELAAGVVVGVQAEGLGGLRLGIVQEGGQVGQVHAGRGVVVLVLPWEPARLQEQVDRAGFESLLAGVGGHLVSLVHLQIGTSLNSPGCIPSRAAWISSILICTSAHLLESKTMTAICLRPRFCW